MRRALAGKACCRSRGNDVVDEQNIVGDVLASTEPCKSARSDAWLTPKLVCQHALQRSRVNLHGVTAYDVLAEVRRHKLQRSRANLHGVTGCSLSCQSTWLSRSTFERVHSNRACLIRSTTNRAVSLYVASVERVSRGWQPPDHSKP